jgi:hypothetical protein
LVVDGVKLSVAQVGSDSAILRDEYHLSGSSDAKIVVTIDGRDSERDVVLFNGIAGRLVKFF